MSLLQEKYVVITRKYVVITRKYVVLTRKDIVITRKYVVLTKKDIVITRKYVVLTRKDIVIMRKYVVLTRKDLVITRKYVVLTRKDLVITRSLCGWQYYVTVFFLCYCGLNKDKPDAEGSEKKTETETLIFSETTAARQKVPDKHNKLTDIFSRQTSTQELATQGTVTIVKNYRTMRQ